MGYLVIKRHEVFPSGVGGDLAPVCGSHVVTEQSVIAGSDLIRHYKAQSVI